MKYYITRTSEYTGRTEYKMNKCTDNWCDKNYFDKYPERVWKFSEKGAKKYKETHESMGWHYKYELVPAECDW